MKKKALILCISCAVFGCQKPEGKWIATEDVPVFKDANEKDELQFIAKKGDICSLGKEWVVKAFMYREIQCQQGSGWIINNGSYPFEPIDNK